jgi:hypothetical protein
MFKQKFIIFSAIVLLASVSSGLAFGGGKRVPKKATFKIRVENIADANGIAANDGSKYPFALSPGFFIVSNKNSQIFETGKKAGKQLEAQAEDGNPELFLKKYFSRVGSLYTGIFNKPIGKDMASPIFSGGTFEFEIYAEEGMKLNLALMYGQSNDLFYAPDKSIDLFDANGNALNGDVTDLFKLWDAGTEVNEAPGLGADQGPRQKGPNTGATENGVVKLVSDGFTYPDTENVLRVTITAK